MTTIFAYPTAYLLGREILKESIFWDFQYYPMNLEK